MIKIYYSKKDDILTKITRQELENYSDGRNYYNDSKYIEHLIGIYMVRTLASKYYSIEDTDIIYEKNKPKFKTENINFSISHSHNIVAVGFCKYNIGIDVEKMKDRDFSRLAKRYNINPEKKEFYEFWTKYEAEIKLGKISQWSYTSLIEDEYMLSCVSDYNKNYKVNILNL